MDIFRSAAMKLVLETVERVAPSEVGVFLTGEAGTGKDMIANLLHALSPRSEGPFLKIHCAAMPRELIESELFGSLRGTFTGSQTGPEGYLRRASGGALLLDELPEMRGDVQAKLLRALQKREVSPVGGETIYPINCRVIASTSQKIEGLVQSGKLRQDLYYHLSTISIHLPPLRERREDILPLALDFLKGFAAQANRPLTGFTAPATAQLRNFNWPGNVRQLQNEVQRAVLMSEGLLVDVHDLSIPHVTIDTDEMDFTFLEGTEREAILELLKRSGRD